MSVWSSPRVSLSCGCARSSVEALRRFSSGDLQSECDEGEVDPYTGRPATTSQPKPQNQRPPSQGKIYTFIYLHLFKNKLLSYNIDKLPYC